MPTENTGGTSQNGNGTVAPVRPSSSNSKQPQRDPQLSARDEMLAELDRQIEEQRTQDEEYMLRSGDPRAIQLKAQMDAERGATDPDAGADAGGAGEAQEAQPAGEEEQAGTESGGAPSEPDDEAARQARVATEVRPNGEDPLAEFVVRQNGKPMMKLLVDGRERFVPLEDARRQLQKHAAADIRLQQAAELKKNLDAREAQIRQSEAALRARAQSQPSAEQAAADDQALERESVELVRSLVSEPEADAAKKLAKVLKTVRQAATPRIDPNAIAEQAANVAVQKVAARDTEKAMDAAWTAFQKDYSDIAADPDLFALADRRSDEVKSEHPEWTPTEILLEAGKRTRDWLATRTGAKPKVNPNPSGRQARKEGLRPMPRPMSTRVAAPTADPDAENSPQAAMAEIRKARGQAY